ncbi:COX assembly mitochondrial protein 2 homolog isoform X2 [Eubalaena glacialis]|uniref:COX assembly mitochondrial protein 2 homolog isoform X2 n=1 Tax=Eubalaena glacialis TaxID=27606 RepID=UPI002A5A5941|nr:COX assembly mitochondrial protein 2 homolog isoform X2 [Eubalaena glacialis]
MRIGRRAVGAGRAGSGVEGAEPSPPGAVPAPAPWPPAFGCSVFAGEYRFRSPGVAASRYMEKRNKSRERGNAMRKRLFNPPEESEK